MAKPRRTQAETPALVPLSQAALSLRDSITALVTPTAPDDSPWHTIATQIADQHTAEFAGQKLGYLANPPLIAALLHLISNGMSPTQACHRCGLSHSVLTDWTHKADQAPEGSHAAVMAATKAAVHMWGHRLTERIELAGQKEQHWTALAWLKERSPQFANDYKLQQVTGGGNVIVNVGVYAPTDVRIGGESVSSSVIDVRPVPVSD